MHDLRETPIGSSCGYVVVAGSTSLDLVDNISLDSLDAFCVLSSCSLSSPSPECHNLSHGNYNDMLDEGMWLTMWSP